jgi:17beta-estradiol 17-dehydrogenase / very-long-chain 3-oxoacyl-CoA reductase
MCVRGLVQVPEYVYELDEKTTLDILQVNIEGTVCMTRAVVPFLTAKRKGAIINVSSGSGNHPTPMISCYASTKVTGRSP